eukprot:m.66904 g.66904  ORF g.66904 m.66904 type:complete len:97 (+) comp9837_c0_seq1:144-434(+)
MTDLCGLLTSEQVLRGRTALTASNTSGASGDSVAVGPPRQVTRVLGFDLGSSYGVAVTVRLFLGGERSLSPLLHIFQTVLPVARLCLHPLQTFPRS